ncbi:hypothetical protein [Flectobacillus sp. BAB-3569]|uniref:hypothetical protein n=1 Tax=Flectobacillus sp. BAB-3569 TaxID=1509483 RepID=UPI0011401B88|nr:hypothetical protein [Flectobacillus sp. BAB-3569]
MVRSQSNNPFKLDILVGIAKSSSSFGGGISVEPKYCFNDKVSVGLKFESANAYGSISSTGPIVSGPINSVSSYLVTSEYCIGNYGRQKQTRPFFGVGFGIYNAIFESENAERRYDKMGASLRGGVDIKHLRLSVEQNFILSSSQYELNFLTLRLGLTIGRNKNSIP